MRWALTDENVDKEVGKWYNITNVRSRRKQMEKVETTVAQMELVEGGMSYVV